ncbi:hypothetical protein J0A68_18160 [Algoriphagus sp. H41]|uniref:Secreted protein n=1 Tax=Algoriphagus oliviformis TaxID=2811231 RepID=A0ABS3C705_9BACT|nr:hypothetical protein [Algoriphagus oliviformis]MBN7812886.1 hypothetical protein [Algoriphagus oliviformis]
MDFLCLAVVLVCQPEGPSSFAVSFFFDFEEGKAVGLLSGFFFRICLFFDTFLAEQLDEKRLRL